MNTRKLLVNNFYDLIHEDSKGKYPTNEAKDVAYIRELKKLNLVQAHLDSIEINGVDSPVMLIDSTNKSYFEFRKEAIQVIATEKDPEKSLALQQMLTF